MTPSRPTPLADGVLGDTNLFGFVVTLNFTHELLKNSGSYAGNQEVNVPQQVRDHHSTFTHQGIHFFHAMSTSYLYRFAVVLWKEVQRSRDLVRGIPRGTTIRLPLLGTKLLGEMFAAMRIKSNALSCPQIPGVSAHDVIESAAVFISYRMHLPDMDHGSLMNRLDATFGSGLSPYCDAFRLGDWYLGEDLFEVFSPICFLALCSVDPGLTYCRSIETLGKSGILRRNKHPSFREIVSLMSATGISEFRTAPEEIDISGKHPILTPYILQLMRERPDLQFAEFGARPYESDDSDLFEYLVPPLVRYADGRGILSAKLPTLLPLAANISESDRARQHSAFLVHFTAICGAVLAMAEPADYHMQCPHKECPYYRLRLCYAYAPIPEHHRECGFVDTFEDLFQRPLQIVERA